MFLSLEELKFCSRVRSSNVPCSSYRSGHRKSSRARPDQRDLSETLAATQGLANMIGEAQRLFQVTFDLLKSKTC